MDPPDPQTDLPALFCPFLVYLDSPGDHWAVLVTSVTSGFGSAFDEFSKLMNPLGKPGENSHCLHEFSDQAYLHVKLCTWFASYLL